MCLDELVFFFSAEEYAKAFVIGYSLEDASALLRLDGLYLESFLVTDIKHLKVQFVFKLIFFYCAWKSCTSSLSSSLGTLRGKME